ncbi:MAG: hypothetical protein R2939_05115 [Kofleriaceae bacterium]
MAMRPALLLSLVLGVTACGKRAGGAEPSCEQVATHVAAMAKAQVVADVALAKDARARVLTELGPLHDAMLAICTDHAWPASVRACMAAAGTGADVKACASSLAPQHRGALSLPR